MAKKSDPGGEQPPFTTILSRHRDGMTDLEIADRLGEVARAVRATRKPGSVAVTIKVVPSGDEQVGLAIDLKATVPSSKKVPVYYVDDSGRLSRRRPGQLQLADLRDPDDEENDD